ncbi:hypothetical protein SADUNF_Sadunf13G0106800 [Salix dunnii]|uniref:Uncharacterized protein n=1 Tax=Salix dunnii TaxID=1413687 RepID=A0A835MNQ7_9ROSI|nr:hypothetical protein SADUNF_Sadunf13G0106800 [Salix dunnii]
MDRGSWLARGTLEWSTWTFIENASRTRRPKEAMKWLFESVSRIAFIRLDKCASCFPLSLREWMKLAAYPEAEKSHKGYDKKKGSLHKVYSKLISDRNFKETLTRVSSIAAEGIRHAWGLKQQL